MLNSSFARLVPVALPYQGRQLYMGGFDLANPVMPEGFEDYLEPVKNLCIAASRHVGKAFMTVDEKVVQAGMSQRRPGPHVDGNFMPAFKDWKHGGGGWNHTCNNVPIPRMEVIVAASVSGCRAWDGQFDGVPSDSGDLSHIADQLGEGVVLPPNVGFLLSPDCVHESMVFEQDTARSFLRIALPIEDHQ